MNKRKFSIAGGIFLYSFIIIAGWLIYSLFRFDGYYSPVYVYGLSNPFKYYQKHIGSLLVEHGTEYKIKTTIDEQDPETYKVYRNEEYNFEFKYPKEYRVQTGKAFYPNISTTLTILNDKDSNSKCEILVMYRGRGVGRNWLPKKRGCIDWMIVNNKELRYFYAKNGQIVHTTNCGMPDLKLLEDKGALIDYTDKNSDKMYYITIGGKQCSNEIMINVITTFQFIE